MGFNSGFKGLISTEVGTLTALNIKAEVVRKITPSSLVQTPKRLGNLWALSQTLVTRRYVTSVLIHFFSFSARGWSRYKASRRNIRQTYCHNGHPKQWLESSYISIPCFYVETPNSRKETHKIMCQHFPTLRPLKVPSLSRQWTPSYSTATLPNTPLLGPTSNLYDKW